MKTATTLPFPTEQPGLSANMPSLNDMCYTLRQNWATLDEIDQNFARGIFRVESSGVTLGTDEPNWVRCENIQLVDA